MVHAPRGFDDYDMRLGDMMRGERATMGKSLLDVQRELRIKASYIAAIENCDPEAFETQGFVAGYVRSYARYLGLDPDATFAQFCAESGFQTAHGMDSAAGGPRKETRAAAPRDEAPRDPFREPALPFAPAQDSFFARLEPGAIGSVTVLVALIAALGYGGWSVLQEVQRVQVVPVDQTPVVLSDLDPLQGAGTAPVAPNAPGTAQGPAGGIITAETPRPGTAGGGFGAPSTSEGFDRLYRPQALDVPILAARDKPISSIDQNEFANFAERLPEVRVDEAAAAEAIASVRPATGTGIFASDALQVVAARPSWIRVSDADGGELFSGILDAGDTWALPPEARDATIQVGESGAIYYVAGGRSFGPTGPRGTATQDFALDPALIAAILPEADLRADAELAGVLTALGKPVQPPTPTPQVVETFADRVTIVATREAWVRVRAASGSVLYESVMQPGDFYTVPATEEAPTIRTGNAGAIFFAAAGQTYGPYGANGAVADNLALSVANVTGSFAAVDLQDNTPLARAVAELNAATRAASE